MEKFTNLPWRIKDPAILDKIHPFLSEETLLKSEVFSVSLNDIASKKVKSVKSIEKNCPKIKKEDENLEKMIPGYRTLPFSEKSNIYANVHKLLIDAMKIIQNNTNTKNLLPYQHRCIKIYKKLEPKIAAERAAYIAFVTQKWKQFDMFQPIEIRQKLDDYFSLVWTEKFKTIFNYSQYYKGCSVIPLVYNGENKIEMTLESNLLELGDVPNLQIPRQVGYQNVILDDDKLPDIETIKKNVASNNSILRDDNANKLAEDYNVDIVITSSGLKQLVDNRHPYTRTWCIPILIKEFESVNEKGQKIKKKIVFIDKPLPSKNLSNIQKNYWAYKKIIKESFCTKLEYSFPKNIDFNINTICDKPSDVASNSSQNSTENKKKTHIEATIKSDVNESIKRKRSETDSDEDDNLIIAMDELEDKPVAEVPKKKKCNNIWADVSQNNIEEKVSLKNVLYRLWNLSPEQTETDARKVKQNLRVLVRCRIDACKKLQNASYQPLVVVPKVEYQLNYGAEMPTVSEIFKQWISLFIRPCSQLVRVRIDPKTSDIIYIQEQNIKTLWDEAKTYNCNPNECLSTLYSVFNGLIMNPPGNYLLSHVPRNESFVTLYKNSLPNVSEFNLYEAFLNSNQLPKEVKSWIPLDVNIILPNNIKQNVLPGTFKTTQVFNKGKKNKKKK